MVAAVETMAYAGELPWHGLGTKVPNDLSTDQMLEASGLNWSVEKLPSFVTNPFNANDQMCKKDDL